MSQNLLFTDLPLSAPDPAVLAAPNFKQAVVAIPTAGVPTLLSATNKFCRRVVIYGRKAARTDNTSDVWVGPVATTATQPVKIPVGGEVEIVGPGGALINLAEWYAETETDADGLVIVYDEI